MLQQASIRTWKCSNAKVTQFLIFPWLVIRISCAICSPFVVDISGTAPESGRIETESALSQYARSEDGWNRESGLRRGHGRSAEKFKD